MLYVNDILLVKTTMDLVKEVKLQMSSMFDMKDLDAAHFILGMEIKRDRPARRIWLN